MSIKNPPKSGGLNESDGKIVPNVLIPPDKEKLEILIGDSIIFLEFTVMVKQINQFFRQNSLFQFLILFKKSTPVEIITNPPNFFRESIKKIFQYRNRKILC